MAETGKNTARRDLLLELQRRAPGKWAREKTFEGDAPKASDGEGIMKAAADSPIIGVQLISISTTNAQFQLSDDVAVDGTYTIEVLASI